MNIEIRKETPAEYRETEEMVRRSFYNVYNPGCDEHLLVHVLRTHEDFLPELSRIALVDGRVAGLIMYFKCSVVTEGGEEITVASFGPLCADHRYKNRGIGGALLRGTVPLAKEAGFPGMIIIGEPDYYPKFGFKRAAEFGLTDMEGNAFDAFMGLELRENGLRIPGGRFKETPAVELCTEQALAALEKENGYSPLRKIRRPCQWSYDNAYDDREGYHYEYATHCPRVFERLFAEYVHENTARELERIWSDIDVTPYVIFTGERPIGIFVVSAAEGPAVEYLFVDAPDGRSEAYMAEISERFHKANAEM